MQNDTPMMIIRSISKPKVEFKCDSGPFFGANIKIRHTHKTDSYCSDTVGELMRE